MSAKADPSHRKAIAALFAHRLPDFLAARKAAAAEARRRSPERARELERVRKPTPVLWALNALAREADADLRAFLDAGEALRTAQRRALAGDATKLASARTDERERLSRLVARGSAILAREGGHATRATERRMRSTLQAAALSDPVRADLLAGALEAEVDAGGIDLVGALAGGAAVLPPPRAAKARAEAPPKEKAKRTATPKATARDQAKEQAKAKEKAKAEARARAKAEARAQAAAAREAARTARARARAERAAQALEKRAARLEREQAKLQAALERTRADAERLRGRARATRGDGVSR